MQPLPSSHLHIWFKRLQQSCGTIYWRQAVLSAPAILIVLAVSLKLKPIIAVIMVSAAFSVGFGAARTLTGRRWGAMGMATLGMALAAFGGSLIGIHPPAALAVAALLAAGCAALSSYNNDWWWVALQIVIAFLVLGYFETFFLLAAAIAFIIFMAYLAIQALANQRKDKPIYQSLIYAIAIIACATIAFDHEFYYDLRYDFAETVIETTMKIFALFIPIYLYIAWRKYFQNKVVRPNTLPPLSKAKEQHYHELGLSDSEIELFRDTMNQAKIQIEQLQKNVMANSKLKALDLRHDYLKISKALFKEIVKNPTRLSDASLFLYTHLPNLVDLTNKYVEINNHEIKNREAYDRLEEGIQVIEQLTELIQRDYQDFVADDFEDMDIEINMAKKHIEKNSDHQTLQF